MHRRALFLVLLLAGASCFAACGSSQNRPVVVETFPAQGDVVPVTLSQVRITFDDAVTILNPTQIVIRTGGVTIPVVAVADEDDPNSILLRPAVGEFWRVGETAITLRSGWEVNSLGHYRLEDYLLTFSLGSALPVYFGVPAPASVVQTEGPDFLPVTTIPTPGGRVPVGMVCSTVGAEQRTWVQLETGGGSGAALAWLTPGAAAMTSVALSFEAGGDLVAEREALWVDLAGTYLYAAYRDTALGRVRLAKIAIATATEVDSLVLSPAASVSTGPQGLAISPDGAQISIACSADAGARLVSVDTESFTEVDVGPGTGVDGLPLPSGAGPLEVGDTLTLIGPLAATEAILSTANLVGLTVVDLPSIVSGTPTLILLTPDRRFVIEGLSGYVDDEAFSYRLLRNLTNERSVVIDDDTGEGNGVATQALDIAWFTGSTRLVALLDNDAAIFLRFLPEGIDQEDLDETTQEAAVDLSGIAPGATLVAIPPPAVPPAP